MSEMTAYLPGLALRDSYVGIYKIYTLLNNGSTDDTRCREYHSYLSSIKAGKSSYHYYYCGETINGGKKVYDIERLSADGFSPVLPTVSKKENHNQRQYNPWKNKRFLKSIGYTEDGEPETLVYCYRDNNPIYYDDDY